MTREQQPERSDAVGELVSAHVWVAERAAAALHARVPKHVVLDDLLSAALDGLWQAAQAFDPAREIKFSTFALYRVRGALMDELRQHDVLSRGRRARANRLAEARRQLMQELGRRASDEELCAATGLSLAEVVGCEQHAGTVSLDDVLQDDGKELRRLDVVGKLPADDDDPLWERAARGLSARQQALVRLYYWEDLSMRAIGEQLGVVESRVSRMHKEIVAFWRSRERDYWCG